MVSCSPAAHSAAKPPVKASGTVTMTMNLGYLKGTGIFMTVLALLVWSQIAARRFHPFLYWATIVASTTAGS